MGAVIRLAECMGLHRDPSSYSTNPVEVQVRRLIWYQICFLDIRTCEAIGPRPQIRRDEYDTRFPLNVEDEDLERAAQRGDNITQDSKFFTSMTITRMRVECMEMYRIIWTERPKLQRKPEPGEKKTTLTGLLSRIQSFRAAMEKTYLPMMSRDNPLHVVAMEMYGLLSARFHLGVLHPFASSDKGKMPERLRQMMMSACIMTCEHGMNIEQQPALKQWSWYVGALHQHHAAMLLLSEMYVARSDPALSARMWRCLDYTFELPSHLGEKEKIRFLLSELVKRIGSYASRRGVRAPSNMPNAGPRPTDGESPWPEGIKHRYLQQVFETERQNEPNAHPQQHGTSQSPTGSGNDASNNSPNPAYSYLASHSLEPQNTLYPVNGPLGAIPQVDWSTVDLSAQDLSRLLAVTNAEPYNFGGFAPSSNHSPTAMPPVYMTTSQEMHGAGSVASSDDALINEIDWVSTYLVLFLGISCRCLHRNALMPGRT